MRREPFVPLLARFPAAVLRDRQLQVFNCLGQAECRIGGFVRVPQVQPKLVRVVEVTFTAVAKPLSQQFVVCEFVIVTLLRQLLDLQVFRLKRDISLAKLLALRASVGLAKLLAGTSQSAGAVALLAGLRNDVPEARDLPDVAEATVLMGQLQ